MLVNISLTTNTSYENQLRIDVLKNPFDSNTHQELGIYALSINGNLAKEEFTLAQELYKNTFQKNPQTSVLGEESQPIEVWNSLTTMREKRIAEEVYWETLSKAYPDYTYSYLKRAEIELELGEKKIAQKLLDQAHYTSPTNKEVKILKKLL
ncbi:hypothetical protein HYW55_06060 [Candidatus Gottesmanbacteria bacterium]|nr:hypothetical protein [Candidatus Gottesmanbacteria bacterium]